MGSPRVRNMLLKAETQNFQRNAFTRYPTGTCTVDPGPKTNPYSTWSYGGVEQTLYEHKTMTDVETPGFHRLMREGKIINSPMTSFYERVESPVVNLGMDYDYSVWKNCGSGNVFDPTGGGMVTGDVGMASLCGDQLFLVEPEEDITFLKDQAITKAWANIDRSKVLAGSSVKEMGQTLSGLLTMFKMVKKILISVKKKDGSFLYGKGNLTKEEWIEVYLNARYNLRPLYYDIKGIMEILNKELTGAMRQTFRGSANNDITSSDVVNIPVIELPYYHWNFDLHRSSLSRTTVRAGVLTDCGPLTLHELLGGHSLVETAWDLIPFSFIVDWFANVGDTISAWSPEMQIKPLTSWVVSTTETLQTSTCLGSDFTCTSGAVYSFVGPTSFIDAGTATRITKHVVREPNYSLPMIPSFRLKLDNLKILDLGLILRDISGFRFASSG